MSVCVDIGLPSCAKWAKMPKFRTVCNCFGVPSPFGSAIRAPRAGDVVAPSAPAAQLGPITARQGAPVFGIAVLARLVLLAVTPADPGQLFRIHETVAESLLAGEGFLAPFFGHPGELVPMAWYPPGFSVFVFLAYAVFGPSVLALKLIQLVLGSVGCVLFADATRIAFGDQRLGFASGIFAALLPITAVHDVNLNTNTSMLLFLMTVGLWFWLRAKGGWGAVGWLSSGAAFALASQFRSEALVFVPVAAVLAALAEGHGRLKRTLLLLCGAGVVVAPWTIRNTSVFGVPSPTAPGIGLILVQTIARYYPDSNAGFGFSENEVLAAEGGQYTDIYWPKPYERDRERVERVVKFVAAHPVRYAGILIRNVPLAWFGHRLFISETASAYSGFLSGGLKTLTEQGVVGLLDRGIGLTIALSMFGLALVGLCSRKFSWGDTGLFWVIAAVLFLLFVPLGALGRYTVPAYLLLTPFAVIGMTVLWERGALSKRTRTA